jgi:choline dehydrogenase-like flavoprotein
MGLRRVMMDYKHWAAFGLMGEILPWPENRVQLAEEKDRFGLPVAKVTFNLYDNDKKLIEFGKRKTMDVMEAAGAKEVVQESRYAHLVGASRMGMDSRSSVVHKFGRSHDIEISLSAMEASCRHRARPIPGLRFRHWRRALRTT